MLLSSGDPYQSSLNPNYKKVGEALESGQMWSIYSFTPITATSVLPIQ